MDSKKITMTVHLNNGNQLVIEFGKQVDNQYTSKLLSEMMEKGIIAVRLEDRGVAIPMSSVACIELSPPLGGTFHYLIEEASLVSSTFPALKNAASPSS